VWNAFSLFAVCVLAKHHHFDGMNGLTALAKAKIRAHFFTFNFERHDRCIESYYCVILKMVILHGAITTIQNLGFVFLFKKSKPVSF